MSGTLRTLALCCLALVSTQSRSPAQENAESATRMQKLVDAQMEIDRAKRINREERAALISQLIRFVEENIANRDVKARVEAAMGVLGELSATESVETLVKYVTYPEFIVAEDGSRVEFPDGLRHRTILAEDVDIRRYPATRALIQIGEPSLDAVIRKIAAGGDLPAESTALHEVLHRLDGPAVRTRLARAIRASREPEVKQRLISTVVKLELQKEEASLTPEEREQRRHDRIQEILKQLEESRSKMPEAESDSAPEAEL